MNGGFIKENNVLYLSYLNDKSCRLRNYELIFRYLENDHKLKNIFSEKEIQDFFIPNNSIKSYVNFYKKLSNYYPVVGDFSNLNLFLEKNHLIEIKRELNKIFDIKCLIIFRDPIRREWSRAGAFTDQKDFVKNNFSNLMINYVNVLNTLYEVFEEQNVCYLIMEHIFNNDYDEKKKLENFLGIKIHEMYPCCYVPDRGINAPKIDNNLNDQWSSDKEILTPKIYHEYLMRKDIAKVYSDFQSFHGSLPADWGSPIDYGY